MPALIGITTAWSSETWGKMDNQPEGIFYAPVQYSNAIYQHGGLPGLITPPTKIEDTTELQQIIEQTLDNFSALFFAGGGGMRRFKAPDMPNLKEQQPLRYNFEIMLLKEAWKRKMPVIGACRGHQMIVEALGGTIREKTVAGHQQSEKQQTTHQVQVTKGSRLAALIGAEQWTVNSMHCQVAETAPPHFVVSARSPEGYIEAIEASDPVFWMGFQFHPEAMYLFDPAAQAVLRAFVEAAKSYSKAG